MAPLFSRAFRRGASVRDGDRAETIQRYLEDIQQLHAEVRALRARLYGSALEDFARALSAPVGRGRAGRQAWARKAARWPDGTFIGRADLEALAVESNYLAFARGGFVRAATAKRGPDGRFLGW
jgi:hypothetical protein